MAAALCLKNSQIKPLQSAELLSAATAVVPGQTNIVQKLFSCLLLVLCKCHFSRFEITNGTKVAVFTCERL